MDKLGYFFCTLQNSHSKKKTSISLSYSKIYENLLKLLKEKNFIHDYCINFPSFAMSRKHEKKTVLVSLKYKKDMPMIQKIIRVSRPGRRIYFTASQLKNQKHEFFVYILSTPLGILCDQKALFHGVGGEVLCKIII
jgi:small subunit ribosomal protein S8